MAIRHGRGRKATMPQLLEGQFAVTKDTEEIFAGIAGKNVRALDEKDREELLEAIDNVEVDTSNLATKPELNNVTTELAGTAKKEELMDEFWTPKNQPLIDGTEGIPSLDKIKIAEVYQLYDRLIADYKGVNNYITKTVLGKDQSGTYDIWQLDFKPDNYKKTIILSGGLHGDEFCGTIGLYLFLRAVCADWKTNKNLAYMRWNVRMIVVPSVNPWGHNNNTRPNSRGVDINRNSSYKWAEYTATHPLMQKGSEPFSEAESKIIKGVLDSNMDAIGYIDFHNGPWANNSPTFVSVFKEGLTSPIYKTNIKTAKYLSQKYNGLTIHADAAAYPSITNYAESDLHMPSTNVEWNTQHRMWEIYNDRDKINRMVEWFGNSIIRHAMDYDVSSLQVYEQFYLSGRNNRVITNVGNITDGPFVEIDSLALEVPAKFDGVALADISVVLQNTDPASRTTILPRLFQYGSVANGENTSLKTFADRWGVLADGSTRLNLSTQAQINIVKNKKVHIGLAGVTSVGEATLYRYRVRLMLIPSTGYPRMTSYNYIGNNVETYMEI